MLFVVVFVVILVFVVVVVFVLVVVIFVFVVVVVVVVIIVVIVVLLLDLCVAGNLVRIGFPAHGTQVPGPFIAAAVEMDRAHSLVGHGPAAKVDRASQRADRLLARDPAVDHVDRAADCLGTETERGGSAQHLDLFGVRRFEGHGVVGADDGGVAGVESVFHDADPGAAQAANDRPAGAGHERRRVHAWFAFQRLAQCGAKT